jgi:hypothetical protein
MALGLLSVAAGCATGDEWFHPGTITRITPAEGALALAVILVEENPGIYEPGQKTEWSITSETIVRLDLDNGEKRVGTVQDLRLGARVRARTTQTLLDSGTRQGTADEVVILAYAATP